MNCPGVKFVPESSSATADWEAAEIPNKVEKANKAAIQRLEEKDMFVHRVSLVTETDFNQILKRICS